MLSTLLLAACSRGPAADSGEKQPPQGSDDTAVSDAAVASGPNLLIVSIDTLRRDAVGRYGGYETPKLDELLSSGLTLDKHRSCSNWTFPSVICALGGADPIELGFVPAATPNEAPEPLPDEIALLGDLLRERGYRSLGIITSPFLSTDYNGQRWDHALYNIDFTASEIVDEAVLQVEELVETEETEGAWVLHTHFMEPHTPLAPPDGYVDLSDLDEVPWDLSEEIGMEAMRQDWRMLSEEEQDNALEVIDRLYGGEVVYLDDQLDRLFSELEAVGALDDTIVLLFSDHGEQFMEHGGITHGQDLYAEEGEAIAAFLGPGFEVEASEASTTHADLLPTLYQALGLDAEDTFTGSVVSEIAADRARTALHLFENGTEQTLDLGTLRLLYRWNGDLELYDLANDPVEQHNLAPEVAWREEVRALWKQLEPHVNALDELYETAEPVWPEL